MVSITLSVPEDLKAQMDTFPEMNWSAVARKAIQNKIILLEKINKLLEKSELTEEDALRFGEEINKGIAKRFKELKAK